MSRLDYCKHELVDDCYDWKNNNCDECNIFKAYCEGARRAKASIGSYTGFCKSQLITCHFVKACNGVCPFEDALKHADQVQTMNEQHTIDHDRDWIIGCIEHDGFIHTDRFDKANQIIHDALLADAGQTEQWIDSDIDYNNGLQSAIAEIRALPSADRPSGEWIKHNDRSTIIVYYTCSECGEIENGTPPYCRKCGAKMGGEHND